MNKNLFSFAINCFDEELHIFNCIYSIYNLTDDIIIINNNSTDNTDKEIKQFIELYDLKEKKITYIKENKNLSIADARNKALSLCKNEFIVKWDGDFINYKVEYCLNYIKENEKNNIHFDLYMWSAPNFYYDIDHLAKDPTYIGKYGDHFISRKNSIFYYISDKYPDSWKFKNKKSKYSKFFINETHNNNKFFFFHMYKIKPLKYIIYRGKWSTIHRKKIPYKNIYQEIENITGKKFNELEKSLKNKIKNEKDSLMIKHNNDIFSKFLCSFNISLFKFGKHCILKDYKNDYIKWLYDDTLIEKFNTVLPSINNEITIYEKSFLFHDKCYNDFKYFLCRFNNFLKYKNKKKLVLLNNLYIKIKPLIEILNIDFKKEIIILTDDFKYNFKNLIFKNIKNYNLDNHDDNLSFLKNLIEFIDKSKDSNLKKDNIYKIFDNFELD